MATTVQDRQAGPISPTAGPAADPRLAQPGAPLDAERIGSGAVSPSIPGRPSAGPEAPPDGPPPGPTPTPGPSSGGAGGPPPAPSPGGGSTGGAPAPGPGDTGTSAEEQFAAQAASNFFDLIRNATSPDAMQAQNIILRRIALQGDIVNSRLQLPNNVTVAGGVLNLLTDWGELEMRSQVLAAMLGVAGPNPQLGWTAASTAIGFRPLMNDRPAGPMQASIPVTVMVRNDYYDVVQTALATLHNQGCVLPLLSGPLSLPAAGGTGTLLVDPLDYLGRVLRIAPGLALADPTTDPLALVKPSGAATPFALAARSLSAGPVAVTPADYDALQTTAGALASVALAHAPLVMVGPVLATAGFSLAGAVPVVGSPPSDSWARFVNIGGLIAGQTRLGDELMLVHDRTEIAASAFAGMLDWRWTGTAFAP